MTEAEWLRATACQPMLAFLVGRVSDRKRRLFACACCRRYGDWVEGTPAAVALDMAEAFADGLAAEAELRAARQEADDTAARCYADFRQTQGLHPYLVHVHASACSAAATPRGAYPAQGDYAARAANHSAQTYAYEMVGEVSLITDAWRTHRAREEDAQAHVLRDVVGNPFRAVAFAPAWRTDTALALARQMYDSREFGAAPILADALQDAGCDSDDLLNHLRDPRFVSGAAPADAPDLPPLTHVRGCWVVDLVLGKE